MRVLLHKIYDKLQLYWVENTYSKLPLSYVYFMAWFIRDPKMLYLLVFIAVHMSWSSSMDSNLERFSFLAAIVEKAETRGIRYVAICSHTAHDWVLHTGPLSDSCCTLIMLFCNNCMFSLCSTPCDQGFLDTHMQMKWKKKMYKLLVKYGYKYVQAQVCVYGYATYSTMQICVFSFN